MAGKIIADFQFGTGQEITGLINDLVTGGIDKALTAEQGKLLFAMFTGGAAHFKIPNPLAMNKPWIIQFVSSGSVPAGGSSNAFWPVAFPNACLAVSSTPIGNAGSNNSGYIAAGGVSTTAVDLHNWGSISAATRLIAIGC